MSHQWLMVWVSLVVVVAASLVPLPPPPAPATKLYIGQSARLTAQIPASWTVDATETYDYRGTDGFVASQPITGQSLRQACSNEAASPLFAKSATVMQMTWDGQPACRLVAQGKADGRVALVVAHPHPFAIDGTRYGYAAVIADPAHFASIAASLDFSPDRVTPVAYVLSVLDLMQARAYWSDDVNWPLLRQQALAEVSGLPPMLEVAQGALFDAVQWLRGAGDSHSFILFPNNSNALAQTTEYGMFIGGRRVVAVFPAGPADRAGVRQGDVITAVNGQPFQSNLDRAVDPAMLSTISTSSQWSVTARITLQRPGVAHSITVTITLGPYSRYRPPSGRRLSGNIGYLMVPYFDTPGQESAYVAAAQHAMAAIESAPTCGWGVDLRLNGGGNYMPMILALGPILGNGTFVGWQRRDGSQIWVSYENGQILQDGTVVATAPAGTPAPPASPQLPPVAVLIGPQTASSGEVTTLAFVGRPGARLFGEPTAGLTTANKGYRLFDGTTLVLAEDAMIDRTGATHMAGIVPNERVPTDWATYGTAQDPVLSAAEAWLHQQAACRQATPAA